jgi:hypothetical protein
MQAGRWADAIPYSFGEGGLQLGNQLGFGNISVLLIVHDAK